METKEDLIGAMSRTLMRIINKHSCLEARPIRFGDDLEVTHREIHAIQAIGEHARINITDLGRHFGVTKSAASQMVAKLAEKGLVEKEPAAHSNKEYQLSLTESGRRAFGVHEEYHGRHMAELAERLEAFSLLQIATASVLLEVIESVVDEHLGGE